MTKPEPFTNCIYCDLPFKNLTDEHIIPLGLGGTNILYSSSCLNCNKATSKVEFFILRGHWLGIRKQLNTGTRRKNRLLDPLKVNLIIGNNIKIPGTIPVEECNIHLVFSFYEPEILNKEIIGVNKPYAKSINALVIGTFGPSIFTTNKGISYQITGSSKIEYLINEFTAVNFFMFLAKVGHSFAIKERGINACENYFLKEIILGETKDAMKYIGNASEIMQGQRLTRIDNFHSLEILETGKYLTVLVQLFNVDNHDIQPIYQIVVGELS